MMRAPLRITRREYADDTPKMIPRFVERFGRTTAIHEAAHAIAAIRGGWRFEKITIDHDFGRRGFGSGGQFLWGTFGPPLRIIARHLAIEDWRRLYKRERRFLVCHALAGAWAVRALKQRPARYERYPSSTDVELLEFVDYWPRGTSKLCGARLFGSKGRETAAQLDQIFANDGPMVAEFIENNRPNITEIAAALAGRVNTVGQLHFYGELLEADILTIMDTGR